MTQPAEREINPTPKDKRISVAFTPEGRISSGEFPTDVRGRYETLVNTFNSSVKARLFLLIPEFGEISSTELERAFTSMESANQMRVAYVTTSQYVHKNFLPAGLVSERTVLSIDNIINTGKTYFSLTEDGRTLGVKAAKLVSEFDESQSRIIDALGPNQSPSNENVRAPSLRSQILLLLLISGKPLSKKNILERLNQPIHPSTMKSALDKLSENELITYEALGDGKATVIFEIARELTDRTLPNFTHDHVVIICQALSSNGIPITVGNVRIYLDSDEINRYRSKTDLDTSLSCKLNKLARYGFLRKTNLAGGDRQSRAIITEKGEKFVKKLIIPLMSIAGYSEQQINATPKVFFGERMLRQTLEFIKSTDLKEEAKQALAAYCVFSAFGLEKAATILGITVFQLKKYIDIVHSDNNLIAIFDTLYPEDAEDELREEDGEEVS